MAGAQVPIWLASRLYQDVSLEPDTARELCALPLELGEAISQGSCNVSQCHSSTWATISKVNVSHAHEIVTAESFPQQDKENTHAHATRTQLHFIHVSGPTTCCIANGMPVLFVALALLI